MTGKSGEEIDRLLNGDRHPIEREGVPIYHMQNDTGLHPERRTMRRPTC